MRWKFPFQRSKFRGNSAKGFSLVEVMIVVVVALIVVAIAAPNFVTMLRNFRSQGDARDITAEILLAKMRAAANFTRSRVYFDRAARQWRTETWNKTATANCAALTGGTGAWCREGVGAPQNLSTGVDFGTGSVPGPPAGTQATLAQAPACKPGAANDPGGGADIANTSCIIFSSRGVPVNNAGASYSDYAIYVTDTASVYGTTVSLTGVIQNWRIDAEDTSATHWNKR